VRHAGAARGCLPPQGKQFYLFPVMKWLLWKDVGGDHVTVIFMIPPTEFLAELGRGNGHPQPHSGRITW